MINNTSTERYLGSPKILEYLIFPFFILYFFLVLIVFEFIQRVFALFGQNSADKGILYFNYAVLSCLKLVGTKISFITTEPLPDSTPCISVPCISVPCIIVSNHQSMFDIPAIHCFMKKFRPRFISKKELSKGIPGVSTCLRLSGAAIIDRSDANQALQEIQRFGLFLKKNKFSGVIFPEGTRARDGILKPFKKRGLELLIKETYPCYIIPITVNNSWKFQYRKFGPIPLGINLTVTSGKPILIDESSLNEDITSLVRNEISANLTN